MAVQTWLLSLVQTMLIYCNYHVNDNSYSNHVITSCRATMSLFWKSYCCLQQKCYFLQQSKNDWFRIWKTRSGFQLSLKELLLSLFLYPQFNCKIIPVLKWFKDRSLPSSYRTVYRLSCTRKTIEHFGLLVLAEVSEHWTAFLSYLSYTKNVCS